MSIDKIREELLSKNGKIDQKLLDKELTIELFNYSEVLSLIKLEDLELFLKNKDRSVNNYYIKYLKFVNYVSEQLKEEFKNKL